MEAAVEESVLGDLTARRGSSVVRLWNLGSDAAATASMSNRFKRRSMMETGAYEERNSIMGDNGGGP